MNFVFAQFQQVLCVLCLLMFALSERGVSDGGQMLTGRQEFRLLDEQQQAVVGAEIELLSVQIRDEAPQPVRQVHSEIVELAVERPGGRPRVVTDGEGRVRLPFPEPAPPRRTESLEFRITHPDFVALGPVKMTPSPREISLRLFRGRRIAVQPQASLLPRLKSGRLQPLLGGRLSTDDWNTTGSGVVVSRPVDRARDRLWLSWIPKQGPPEFSSLLKIPRRRTGTRCLLRDVDVQPGMCLQGKLSAEVPRPVINGCVAVIASHHAGLGDKARCLQWSDWTEVHADGTFEFPSLPTEGFVQLHAWCDGWRSAQPTPRDLEKTGLAQYRERVLTEAGLPCLMRSGTGRRTFTVPMQPTEHCRVRLTLPDGNPLPERDVRTVISLSWFSRPRQPASRLVSLPRLLRSELDQFSEPPTVDGDSLAAWCPTGTEFRHGQTDADGVIRLSGIPAETDWFRMYVAGHEEGSIAVSVEPAGDEQSATVVSLSPLQWSRLRGPDQ